MKVNIIESTAKMKPKKKRVCAYVRVSTDSHKQGESLENQIKYYKSKISTNSKYEFVDIFVDRGYTGTTDKRPEFKKIINLCRKGEIDLIYTKSISRLARNTTIILALVRELKLLGVEIIFERENIKTMSGDGELMLTVLSSIAEEESRSVSENIKWRIRRKFRGGELRINTNRFLGYDKDENGNLIINLYESMIVKRIFHEYLQGDGSFKIAKRLNKDKMPTVSGVKWYENTVLEILKNEKYKGDVILQKTYTVDHLTKKKKANNGEIDSLYIENNHQPIVSKEIWEQAQIEMKKRVEAKNIVKGSNKYLNRYPLTGKLYCSKCGAVLRRRTSYNKKIIWQCKNYIKNGKDSCSGTNIADSEVSKIKIDKPTIVKEEIIDGQKYYIYTSKSE